MYINGKGRVEVIIVHRMVSKCDGYHVTQHYVHACPNIVIVKEEETIGRCLCSAVRVLGGDRYGAKRPTCII